MNTLGTFLEYTWSGIGISVGTILIYARITHTRRMAAMAGWTARQRTFGEEFMRREIRQENARSLRLQIQNGWHRPDALELARLQVAIQTLSERERDRHAASMVEEVDS